MKGSEFIRKARMLAKVRGLPWRLDEKRGKGSHVTLYFGEHITVVRNPKQLGIRKDELCRDLRGGLLGRGDCGPYSLKTWGASGERAAVNGAQGGRVPGSARSRNQQFRARATHAAG